MNIEDEFILYHNASTNNDSESQLKLGMHYLKSGRVSDGIDMIKRSSQQEYPPAIHQLANLYEEGSILPFNRSYAFELFKLAAHFQYLPSIYKYGEYLFYGEVGDENQNEGFKYIEFAANNGYPKAEFEISKFYMNGDYVEENIEIAIFWLNKAAEHNNDLAQYELGLMYLDEKIYDKAFELLRRASNNKNPDAMHALAIMYSNGLGIEKDPKIAINWCFNALEVDIETHGVLKTLFKIIGINGKGDIQEIQKFKNYLSMASKNGSSEALEILEHPALGFQDSFRNLQKSFDLD
jgi:TPR repeat protein